MKKDSPFTSDRFARFVTILKGGCEMFQGSLLNRLARSVASLVLVAAIGHVTAAGVEVHAAAPPSHDEILTSLGAVQTTVNTIGPTVDAVDTTVDSIETKVDALQSKADSIPPTWSQILPAADRFQLVMGGAAVLDKETGLVWEQSPLHFFRDWNTGQRDCINLTVGGRKGWRLPTIQELASMVDPAILSPGPTLPPGHPFSSVQAYWYWSQTTVDNAPGHAWQVRFTNGEASILDKPGTNHVWCVRGGQGVNPQ